jgi:hypothetical protein
VEWLKVSSNLSIKTKNAKKGSTLLSFEEDTGNSEVENFPEFL